MDWCEEAISSQHDREGFDCGSNELNTYLRNHARQNHERGHTKTYVAVPAAGSSEILGFYSIAPASIEFDTVPNELAKRFPKYPIPAFLLARLAVRNDLQKQGLGAELLLAAGVRVLRVQDEIGGWALLIDAKDESAATWYKRFGATQLLDSDLRLILPLATIAQAIERGSAQPQS